MPRPIEDYALIGDRETAALVSRDGSIDWLCWPRFDSPACFAALVGGTEHGRWQIVPASQSPVRISRRYREGTLVLETEFETSAGARATLVDFMTPRPDGGSHLFRIVEGRRGRPRFKTEFIPRFDYGTSVPWMRRMDDGSRLAIVGPDMLVMRTNVTLLELDFSLVGEFTVAEGETVVFELTHQASHLPVPAAMNASEALRETEAFWRSWSDRCAPAGPWTDAVKRSLITLKALTYRPTGGILAAPTTSLPEQLSGSRNWDYRFCWLRDSAFTLLALMNAGYYDEASDWRDWLLRAIAGSPAQAQIMYGIAGERYLPERELPWLPGYEGAAPVRVGNAAAGQHQLDVYGELVDAMYQAVTGGLPPHPDGWPVGRVLLDHVERIWTDADDGIWEVRGPRQHFTHSKVMAWVAFDRAVRAVEKYSRSDMPVERWRTTRDKIHADICARAFDRRIGSFVQAYGSQQLDASLLLMPLVGFLPADDPRIRGTVAAIERRLASDGLVRRYDTEQVEDGMPPGEGAFLACSFWLADNYVLQNRITEARALFERLLMLRNDVGLLAEMYDPRARRMVGNFPQAFSHVGLVNTAFNLSRREGPAEQRAAA
jgi:GH15 family glucan-1,4-alpha-glucosidase